MITVVLTGASMGIGRELAVAWGRRGARLVLSARSEDKLREVAREVEAAGGTADVVPGDVTDERHRAELVERAGTIDVLVNNAGRGFYAPAMKIDLDEMRRVFELNVFAPLHLSQLAVPRMRAGAPLRGGIRRGGTIVMLSSIAGVVAAPRYGAYAASKFALEALSMAMRSELAGLGIRVVVIRPGPVRTPFRANAARAAGEVGYDAPDPNGQSAERVAELTVRAVERGTAVVETSAFVRGASAAMRVVPPLARMALRRMAARVP
jgi:short-subunit dehydrogenase